MITGKHLSSVLGTLTIALVFSNYITEVKAASMYDKEHTWDLQLNSNETFAIAWQGFVGATADSVSNTVGPVTIGPVIGAPIINSITTGLLTGEFGAIAKATASVTALANGTGSHSLTGCACVNNGVIAVSSGSTAVALRRITIDGQGRMRWKGDWIIDVIKDSGRETDPVIFTVTNLDTGEIVTTELFSFEVDLDAPGTASWQNGIVQLDGIEGSLSVRMDSPFITSGTGNLLAEFSNGIITSSNDSGIFDGLLPSVGSPANFSFNLGGADGFVDIDFDFGSENTNGYEFNTEFIAEAQVLERGETTPEPSAILGLLTMGGIALGASKKKQSQRTLLI